MSWSRRKMQVRFYTRVAGKFPCGAASKGNFSLHAKFNLSNSLRCNSIVERSLSVPSGCIRCSSLEYSLRRAQRDALYANGSRALTR